MSLAMRAEKAEIIACKKRKEGKGIGYQSCGQLFLWNTGAVWRLQWKKTKAAPVKE